MDFHGFNCHDESVYETPGKTRPLSISPIKAANRNENSNGFKFPDPPNQHVEDLLQKLDQMRERCAELQQQLNNLLEERTLTERQAISLMNSMYESEKRRYESEIKELQKTIDENDAEKEEIESARNEMLSKSENLEEETVNLKRQLELIREESEAELENLQRSLSEKEQLLEQVERKLNETETSMKNLENEIGRLRLQNEQVQKMAHEKMQRDMVDGQANLERKISPMESRIAELSRVNKELKDACKDLDKQCEELMKLRNEYKTRNEVLSDENQSLHVALQKLETEHGKCAETLELERKEKERLEQNTKYWQQEVHATENDYKDELKNMSRLVASEKAVAADYVKEIETLKEEKRKLRDQLTLCESLLNESAGERRTLEESKQLFEEKVENRIAGLEDHRRDTEKKHKKFMQETLDLCEKYKKESEQMKIELEALKHSAQSHELEILKLNATILQYEKLNTHLQTQLNVVPKAGGCFICPDKKHSPNPNALTPARLEEMLAEYRQQNSELRNQIRTLENALSQEKSKMTDYLRRPKERVEITGHDLAIIKKSASGVSDISTGSIGGEGRMRHNIPHRWVKYFVTKRTKCMACMEDLPFSCQCARCDACKATVHHKCAENLMNTCGLPMLYSDHFYEEEKRMKESLSDARMYGWVKLWRSNLNEWNDAWACLEHEVLSFYHSADAIKHGPFARIDLKSCTWKIHLRSAGSETSDACSMPPSELPYVIEIKINNAEPSVNAALRYYMVTPDLISKQRWLAAFQKAIPNPILKTTHVNF